MPAVRRTPAYRNPGWFLALPALAIVLLLVWVARRADPRHQPPRRVLLVTCPAEGPGALDDPSQQALALLVKDVLELNGDLAVTQASGFPNPQDLVPGREGWVLAFAAYRRGLDLELRTWVGRAGELPAAPTWVASTPAPPALAVAALVARLAPVTVRDDRPGILVPRSPEAFWPLLQAMALQTRSEGDGEALDLAAAAELGAPGCATPALLRGQILGFRAVERNARVPEDLDRAREAYEEALRRAPGHPRASYLLARLLADTGRMREALILTRQLSRAHPHTGPTFQALAYVGRNGGLLDLAEAGAAGSREVLLDLRHPARLQVGLLYVGRWEEFESTLWRRPGEPYDAVIRFHLGYLELLRGRRAQALDHFHQLGRLGGAYPRYRKLGEVFRLALEGQTGAALKQLAALDRELDGLRGADGEFTFNLAEAYALLGDRDGALDLAGRALAQGFACTRWYEQSPLMAPMKGSPRWEALLQTLRERQARLERLFPVSDFPA
ncbi:MAG TPA: tetratricopeptide repeat protein [Holophagaceae bacterium]|nr:tetratricopeptide repeat protein [Holophagaceae bacterium]